MIEASWRRRGVRAAVGIAAVAACAWIAGCGRSDDGARVDSAAGTVPAASDTGALQASAVTPAVGPLIYVTKTDGKSVSDATQLQLTEQRLRQFMTAAESLSALRSRDPRVQQLSQNDLSNAGSTDVDAGLKLLESDPNIVRAIQSAGLSVRDYYVTGITIASALHYTDDPNAAPPTPSAEENAKLLRAHQDDVERIRVLDHGGVVVTPSSGGDSAARH